jgi:hypothetical membrane protein
VDYLLLATTALAFIFMIRLFTPLFNLPFKLLLFNQVQNQRLAIGLMLLCVVQLVLLGVFLNNRLNFRKSLLIAFLAFLFFFDAAIIMSHTYEDFISQSGILWLSLILMLCIFFMLRRKSFTLGLIIFVLLNIHASLGVNPIYTRSRPIALEQITERIKSRYPDEKNWIVLGTVFFHNVPAIAGKPSFSGVYYYPQYKLWQQLDPTGQEVNDYNRFAHAVFTTNLPVAGEVFHSPYPDVLLIRFNCDIAAKLPNVGYILSSEVLDSTTYPCLEQDDIITYPAATIWIYKYSAPAV